MFLTDYTIQPNAHELGGPASQEWLTILVYHPNTMAQPSTLRITPNTIRQVHALGGLCWG